MSKAKKPKLEKEVLLEFVNVQIGTVIALNRKIEDKIEVDVKPLLESLKMLKDYINDPRNLPAHII